MPTCAEAGATTLEGDEAQQEGDEDSGATLLLASTINRSKAVFFSLLLHAEPYYARLAVSRELPHREP